MWKEEREPHRRGHVGTDGSNIVIYTSALRRRLSAAASKWSHEKKCSAVYNYNDMTAICLMTWRTTMSKYVNHISKAVIIIHLLVLEDIQRHKIAVCLEQLLCARHCAVHYAYILSKSLKQL